jgi:hypothetical protein
MILTNARGDVSAKNEKAILFGDLLSRLEEVGNNWVDDDNKHWS